MQFMFTYIRKPVRLTWVWRISALPGRRVSTQPGEGECSELDRASFLNAQPFSWSEAACLDDLQVCFFQIPVRNKTPSWEKWGSWWVLPISLFSLLSGSLAALTQEAKGRLNSASRPPAPSWANTMLGKCLQTTFLPVLCTKNPQGQCSEHSRHSSESFHSQSF